MKLNSIRELDTQKNVLKNTNALGPDPVYWVFSEVSNNEKWANVTIITSGNYDSEYPKTFGHYHGVETDETYHLISGEGVLVLQKKHFENGVWIPEKVSEVILIKAQPGDEIVITPEWGHSWSNIGATPLISFDDWRSGHTPNDYSDIERLHGLAYYIINRNGEITPVKNENYLEVPLYRWMTAAEFVTYKNTSV